MSPMSHSSDMMSSMSPMSHSSDMISSASISPSSSSMSSSIQPTLSSSVIPSSSVVPPQTTEVSTIDKCLNNDTLQCLIDAYLPGKFFN
jgi:hypothetical protein